ncbi:N-alpha-acetyltransferase 30 [Silurus asotus]|uniref:N-alpha-acetyltransferase 30 n=1 Tax=Silurus asotus TaxID=30991 RepID=A0AAD5FUU3_SILAS|nr:N-alpha-acetyltransferase 30 [Silurus asotus]
MAEVPPGPNTLPASSAEIRSLPVDGCSFLGNNETLDCGRGDIIAPGTEAQQATEPKGIVKLSQNSVHHLNSPAQLHSSPAQLNGIASHPEHDEHLGYKIAQNHVQHRAHRSADCQHTASEYVDSTGERATRKSAYNASDSSLPSNGVDSLDPAARTEPSSSDQLEGDCTCLKAELDRTVCRSECKDHVQKSAGDRERGLGAQGDGAEEAPLEDQIAKLSVSTPAEDHSPITYVRYESELQMPDIIRLITKDLSEPYSIYTYRYFIHNWPQLCFLVCM